MSRRMKVLILVAAGIVFFQSRLRFNGNEEPMRSDVARLAEALAAEFHAAYEQLAPDFGYQTRRDSAVSWENVPEPNRSLMVAVAGSVLGGSVVDAIARQRAAEELEAAAKRHWEPWESGYGVLCREAAALRATS